MPNSLRSVKYNHRWIVDQMTDFILEKLETGFDKPEYRWDAMLNPFPAGTAQKSAVKKTAAKKAKSETASKTVKAKTAKAKKAADSK